MRSEGAILESLEFLSAIREVGRLLKGGYSGGELEAAVRRMLALMGEKLGEHEGDCRVIREALYIARS